MIERTDIAAHKAGNRVVELEDGETVGVVSNIEVIKESLAVERHEPEEATEEVPTEPVAEEGA